MKKKLFFTVLFLTTTLLSQAQSPIPIFRGSDYESPFIDKNGKEVFRLPEGHKPVTKHELSYLDLTVANKSYQSLNVFRNGMCVIKDEESKYYLINEKGEVIQRFDERYNSISAFTNGYFLAHEPIGQKRAYWLVYLDKNGKNAFGEKKFWKASPFSEGYASVQLTNDNGPWGFINKSGEMVVEIPDFGGTIKNVGPLINGLSKVSIQKNPNNFSYDYIFINKKGKEVFNVNKKFPDREIGNLHDYSDGLLAISFSRPNDISRDIVWLDKKGKIVFEYESLSLFGKFRDGLNYIQETKKTSNNKYGTIYSLINKKGEKIEFKLPEGQRVVRILQVEKDFILTQILKDKEILYALYDRKGLKQLLLTKEAVIFVEKDRIILKSQLTDTYSMRTLAGEILWETPIKDRNFAEINEALKYKEQVTSYTISEPSDFNNGLFSLVNLERLTLKSMSLKALPEGIKNLQNLKTLEILDVKELKIIPKELVLLKNLKRLYISSCPDYKSGLEYVIEFSPSLKNVDLTDVPLINGFERRMKKLKPDLEIFSISTDMILIDFDEN